MAVSSLKSKHYVGDIGTIISMDVGTDITDATTTEIIARKPSGDVVTWTATIFGARILRYTVQAGDWDEEGMWETQANVATPSWSGRGEETEFELHAVLA